MRKSLLYISAVIASMLTTPALAIVENYIPNAESVGKGRLTVMFWDVYDASLYAPNGEWNQERPFALQLDYLRDIEGGDIANRSAEEIRKLGFTDEVRLAAWYSEMRAIFPDVKNGSTLTGVYVPPSATKFYDGNTHIGTVNDPEFARWFFAIWLDEKTSEPKLREQLLGAR